MPDWKALVSERLRSLAIDPAQEPEIIEELVQHVSQEYQQHILDGTSEEAAYDAIVAELSDKDRIGEWIHARGAAGKRDFEPTAAASSGNWAVDFARDLRHASRSIQKTPAFSFFAILTLALGIGCGTAVFTIINTLLLHPLPVNNPSQLVAIRATNLKDQAKVGGAMPNSYQDLQDYESRNRAFSSLAGYSDIVAMTMPGATGPRRLLAELVTAQYFSTLGIEPAKGRFFQPREDTTPGSEAVAVLSYNAWKGKFGEDRDIIGRRVEINGTVFTVVGVAPPGFIGISPVFGPDVWLPATMAEQVLPAQLRDALKTRARALFLGIARLKPGVTRAQANAELGSIASALAQEYRRTNENRGVSVEPITSALYSNTGGRSAFVFGSAMLLVIVGLVLAIACSNVANLLLARTVSRRQEIALRLAMGASRSRVIRQLLTESLLLGFLGGVAGLAVSYGGCKLLWSMRPAEVAQNFADPRIDLTVFLFAAAIAILTGILFGLAPARQSAKADLVTALKEESRIAGAGRRSVSFANLLLVFQVAFSLVCLIAAALFMRSVQRAYQINPGFDTNHLAIFLMNTGQAGYDQARTEALYRNVRERVGELPGVAAASWASNLPFWANPTRGLQIPGREQKKSESLNTVVNTVDLGYFDATGVPLVSGRVFAGHDQKSSAPVAVVNEYIAQKYWPNGNAIGRRIQLAGDPVAREIVGVVRNANYSTLGEAPQACVYLPLRQNFSEGVTLYVRSKGDPANLLNAVQREVRNYDRNLEISDARTGGKIIGQVLWVEQISVGLLSVFGALALALASVGLYGILAYMVGRRQREIGVRMALGANRAAVLRLVLRQGMKLVATGVAIGLVLALLVGRGLSRLLYGTSPADPVSLLAASAVLLAVAFIACYIPAHFASRVDPIEALRES